MPPEPPKPKGGRPRVPDRAALAGTLYVFVDRTSIPLAALISPANWHDSSMSEPPLNATQPIKSLWDRPRKLAGSDFA